MRLAVRMQYGITCKGCPGRRKCRDRPGQSWIIEFDCPMCNGYGCDYCGDDGHVKIDQCPLEIVTEEIWQMIDLADMYKKGLPPIVGGVLDQAQAFIEAVKFIWSEQDVWKAKLGIMNDG